MSSGPDRVEANSTADVTRLLNDAAAGKSAATNELFQAVYDQLRQIARQRMAHERPDHTLQATALVHEAYVRLVGDQAIHWATRAHFFSAAAEAMRRILIEQARRRGRIKRGGDRRRVPLSLVDLAAEEDLDEIVTLDNGIRRLQEQEPEVAQVVHLRFYAGLGIDDTAATLGVSPRTVDRLWAYARAWLFREIARSGSYRANE
jgi:RNA polymerase sigma factor (TIGR02999 family)